MADILVVDDDENICFVFQQFLEQEGYTSLVASSAEDALKIVRERRPDLVIMDIRMPGTDGLEALDKIRQLDPSACVVIMTAYGTSQTSIEAMRLGAYDYLTKPLDLDTVKSVIEKALEARALSRAVATESGEESEPVDLVGSSPPMQEVYKLVGLLAANDVPALILGERGAGKQLVARTIHRSSSRRENPFAVIHCRPLPENLLEGELFGREGADTETGSERVFPGKLEVARGGTVFLDDVDAMSLRLQAKLFRFLVDGRFERAGGVPTVAADTRILATADHDLDGNVRNGRFSQELYDWLRVICIRLPPLRERPADIPELVTHFIKRCNKELNKTIKGVDSRVMQLFMDYVWPGNVTQLQNVIKRAVILARGEVITANDVRGSLEEFTWLQPGEAEGALHAAVQATLRQRLSERNSRSASSLYHDIVGAAERALVAEALLIAGGNQVKAAKLLGLNRTTLRKKMRLYSL